MDAVGNAAVDEPTVPAAGVLVDRMDEMEEGVAEGTGILLEDELVAEEEAATPIVVMTLGESGASRIESACGAFGQMRSLTRCAWPQRVGMGCFLTNKKQHVFLTCAIVRQHVNTVEQDLRGVLTQAHAIPAGDIVVQRADTETRTGGASPGRIGT